MTILKTADVKKYYGAAPNVTKALDGVSLTVERAEFVAVVGASGSGKSTLLHMMGGLDTPSEGTVSVDQIPLSSLSNEELTIFRRRNIGFIFQDYNLVANLNVRDNIVLPVQLDGEAVDTAYIDGICEMLHIQDKLAATPCSLSGGQKQRVAIARALAAKPAIILADEPTGSLDSVNRWDVFGMLKAAASEFEQTIVMITHDQELALHTDRVIRLQDGKVVTAS